MLIEHRDKRCCRAMAGFSFLLFVALCLGVGRVGAQDERVNLHVVMDDQSCSVCHTERPPELRHDPVGTCTKCHISNVAGHPVVAHPVGEVAITEVPEPLRLTEDGRMVCYTCHAPHADSGFRSMLRVRYMELCVLCHRDY